MVLTNNDRRKARKWSELLHVYDTLEGHCDNPIIVASYKSKLETYEKKHKLNGDKLEAYIQYLENRA